MALSPRGARPYVPPFVGTVTITSPDAEDFFQRNPADDTAVIAVTGTYTVTSGAPTAFEVSIDGSAYALISGTPSAGSFSGNATVQGPCQGVMTVRAVNAPSVLDTVDPISIGKVFPSVGQSNAGGGGGSGGTGPVVSPAAPVAHSHWKAKVYTIAGVYKDHTESVSGSGYYMDNTGSPYGAFSGHGFSSIFGQFATRVMADGYPVCMVPCAKGGAFLDEYGGLNLFPAAGDEDDPSTLFGATNLHLHTLKNGYEAVLWLQGESEASSNDARTTAWPSKMTQYLLDWATYMDSDPRFVIVAIPNGGGTSYNSGAYSTIRTAQLALSGNAAVISVADFESPSRVYDGIHPETELEITNSGNRLFEALP